MIAGNFKTYMHSPHLQFVLRFFMCLCLCYGQENVRLMGVGEKGET